MLGDVAIGQPRGHEREHLALAGGDPVEGARRRSLLGALQELRDQPARDGRREQGFPAGHHPMALRSSAAVVFLIRKPLAPARSEA